ncbi:hypothetical protein M0638_07085 [Roseomonas sp. NAR14]|uniref:Uncharacterized protein n=1 Tax=Roseomonas acroporae TaxID=2937791 RepID=A0A9X2BVM0_9PROT|nr:hypothetical protein [Roseomonas acroporae]MCK8784139.1 hypothetical protein [Roseomonas acroporae]
MDLKSLGYGWTTASAVRKLAQLRYPDIMRKLMYLELGMMPPGDDGETSITVEYYDRSLLVKEDRTALRETLWREILEEIWRGEAFLRGFLDGKTLGEKIDPEFAICAEVDFEENFIILGGAKYSGVRAYWSVLGGSAPPIVQTASNRTDSSRPRGRPVVHDWRVFWAEVVQHLLKRQVTDAELSELRNHMKAWAGDTFGDRAPVDPTIDKMLGVLGKLDPQPPK